MRTDRNINEVLWEIGEDSQRGKSIVKLGNLFKFKKALEENDRGIRRRKGTPSRSDKGSNKWHKSKRTTTSTGVCQELNIPDQGVNAHVYTEVDAVSFRIGIMYFQVGCNNLLSKIS